MKPATPKPKLLQRLATGRFPAITVFIILLSGITATALTSYLFLQNQNKNFRVQFKADVEQRIAAIEREVGAVAQVINALTSFYEASRRVERDEFKKFTASLLQDNPEIEALLWIPRVPHAWRDSYEGVSQPTEESLHASFKVRHPDGSFSDAPVKNEYYPVFFAEPQESRRDLLGFDLSAEPRFRELMEKAVLSQTPQSGRWIDAAPGEDAKNYKFYLMKPFFRKAQDGSGLEPVGFIAGAVRVSSILDSAFSSFSRHDMDILVSDRPFEHDGAHVFFLSDGVFQHQLPQIERVYEDFYTVARVVVGGHTWHLLIRPSPAYMHSDMFWMPWAILFMGLFVTVFFSNYLWNLFKSKRILQDFNRQLKAEVEERQRAEQKVRASEERIRQVVDLVPQMIYARDRKGRFLLANKQTADAYGKTVKELIGSRYQDIHLSVEEIESCLRDDWVVLEKHQAVTVLEERFTDISGAERILQTTKIPYHWDDVVGTVVLGVSIDITERKLLEDVRLSEERYRGVIEQSVDSILLVKRTGEFMDVNQTACEALGYLRPELLKMSLFDVDPSYNEASLQACWNQLKESRKKVTESFFLRKNNSACPVEVSIVRVTIRNEDFLLFSARDITQLKRMNRELQKANTFLDLIFENIPNMVFIKDAKDLRFIRFNKAGADLIGVSREEMIGKNDYDFFPPEEAEFFTRKDREVLEKGELVDIPEEPISTQSQQVRFLHTKKIPIVDENGKPIYLLGISEDVTDQKMTLLRLRQSNVAMENALEGIARMNADAKYVFVNTAYAEMLGYRPDELIGRAWEENIHPQDRNRMKDLFAAAVVSGKVEGELRALKHDGSLFYKQVVIIKNQNPYEEDSPFYCFFKDITEKKYRTSIESKSDLISMVSHELRTPLHSIREGISILLDGLVGEISEDQRDILMTNMLSLDRLARLVNSFLDFQRLEAGVVEFDFKNHDMNDLVRKAVREIETLIKAKGLELEIDTSEKLPLIRCDADRTILVLMNLLGNAVKFTSQGFIRVRTSAAGNSVKVEVQDTGVGIKEEEIPRLFQKFGQLESGKMIAPAGTGLGLAISRKIIEAQQGVLTVESRYNQGSTFSFTVPLAVNSAQMAQKRILS